MSLPRLNVETWPSITECSASVRILADFAYREGMRFNDLAIRPEHLLLAIARCALDRRYCRAIRALNKLEVDMRELRLKTERLTRSFYDMCTRGPIPNADTDGLLFVANMHSRRIAEIRDDACGCGSGGLLIALMDSNHTIPYSVLTSQFGLAIADVDRTVMADL